MKATMDTANEKTALERAALRCLWRVHARQNQLPPQGDWLNLAGDGGPRLREDQDGSRVGAEEMS